MKLGGRRLVARRHSGVDAGVCGDGYRQIRPGVAGSCLALACGRRRGGGRGVSPPWRRSAGASVMAIVRQSPATDFLKNHLKQSRRLITEISGSHRSPCDCESWHNCRSQLGAHAAPRNSRTYETVCR